MQCSSGEALVTGETPETAVAELVAAGAHPARTRLRVTVETERTRRHLRPEPRALGALRRAVRPRGAGRGARRADRRLRRGADRSRSSSRARPAPPHLHRPAQPAHRRDAAGEARRRCPGPAQARGPQPHRVAQDQQRARPGPADPADGQDAGDRRDRGRPARRRHRDRRGPVRPRVRASTWARRTPDRQALNVARMQLLGAEVIAVDRGSRTLKDAINEAMRDWVANVDDDALPARHASPARTRSR